MAGSTKKLKQFNFKNFNDRNRKQRFIEATFISNIHFMLFCRLFMAAATRKNHLAIHIRVSIEITFPPQCRI